MRWDRLGRVVLVLAVFAILASYIRPAVNLFDGWSESRAENARLERLRETHQELTRRVEALRSPEAAIRAAREQGLVAPGERPYVVRGLGRD